MAPMQFFKICCEVLPFFNNWEGAGVILGVGGEREGMRKEVRGKSERKMLKKIKLCNYLVRKRIVINSNKIIKSAQNINKPTDNSLSETRER